MRNCIYGLQDRKVDNHSDRTLHFHVSATLNYNIKVSSCLCLVYKRMSEKEASNYYKDIRHVSSPFIDISVRCLSSNAFLPSPPTLDDKSNACFGFAFLKQCQAGTTYQTVSHKWIKFSLPHYLKSQR